MTADRIPVPPEGEVRLPNGCTLYWKSDSMGRLYYTDECGPPVEVWCPAAVDSTTLLAAIVQEGHLKTAERVNKERGSL